MYMLNDECSYIIPQGQWTYIIPRGQWTYMYIIRQGQWTYIIPQGQQARRSRGGWGGYCPPKYRGGGAQPPLAIPSGSYCERMFYEIAVLSVTVS